MLKRSLFLIFLVIGLMFVSGASAAIPQDFYFALNYSEGSDFSD